MDEAIITSVLKTAMPWIKLKNGPAIDLYFEVTEPKEKKEFFRDFKKGEEIKLPNFGRIEDKIIQNPVETFNEGDLLDKNDEEFIARFVNQQTKKPLLEYDDHHHKFDKKVKQHG
jgi:hypothetical protein